MTRKKSTILSKLEPLTPLDLSRCDTVSEIVDGMRSCSFGARMLGEVAATITRWVSQSPKPIIIYDGRVDHPLYLLLSAMKKQGWFHEVRTSQSWIRLVRTKQRHRRPLLIVGNYAERAEQQLFELSKNLEVIFINNENRCRPGQVKDGHFPNVVFGDPGLILLILDAVLCERVEEDRVDVGTFMRGLEVMGSIAKEVVHGAHTLRKMLEDQDCTVMLTVSGAMTVGKMGWLIDDLLQTGRIKYVSATGALMAHGLVEGSGCRHFKYDPSFDDAALAAEGLNRVTDSIEPEGNFDHIEEIVSAVLASYDGSEPLCSSRFHRDVGRYLERNYPNQRSILSTASRLGIPVVTPAFTDSEIGNDVFVDGDRREREGKPRLVFNQELDTRTLFDLGRAAKRLGIFTIGGGVPRNNTQNVGPLAEIWSNRLGKKLNPVKFFYACRIDPAAMALGHLSGCTYSEGASWRKFDLGGKLAEVHADATIVWPFMQKFATARLR
jgi:deoxyhypusine synthase